MEKLKYSKYVITEPGSVPLEMVKNLEAEYSKRKSAIKSTHLLSVDGEIVKDFFFVDCNWLWSGTSEETVETCHSHDFDEVMGFIGSDQKDPQDLGGKITIWMDGKEEILTKTCLIFITAGTKHGPIVFNRIDKPVFFITLSPVKNYLRKEESLSEPNSVTDAKTAISKYTIITEVKKNFTVAASEGKDVKPPPPPPRSANYRGARVMHLDNEVAKGSFYVDFVWIYEGISEAPASEHSHEWEELFGMVGVDPEHPHDMGGKMSLVLGDETHIFAKSNLVCVPKGLKHCPWKFLDIKKPTLVFTAGPTGIYSGTHKKD